MMPNIKRFKSRMQAGELLAKQLEKYRHDPDAIALALPRGGVPVGFALARRLDIPLDVIAVRKLGVPGRLEFAMGAIASGGLCVLKPEAIEMFDVPTTVIEATAHRELHEIERREKLYRSGRPAMQLDGRTVILVDDGLATGATMLAAIKTVRKRHPAKIVAAAPVGPAGTCDELRREADEVICLCMPDPFYAVGLWYEDFTQIGDDEVTDLLGQARQWHAPAEKMIKCNGAEHPVVRQNRVRHEHG